MNLKENEGVIKHFLNFVKRTEEARLAFYTILLVILILSYGLATGNIKFSDFRECKENCKEMSVRG
jgi:amino acid permease